MDKWEEWDLLINYKPKPDGEKEAEQLLERLGYTNINSVSNNSDYFFKDIDIKAKDGMRRTLNFEVKWDSKINSTNNLFIETISNKNTKRKGWFYYCEADYLLYGDSVNRAFYLIDFRKLKALVEEKKDKFKVREAYDYFKDGIKVSEGYLVPLELVTHITKKFYI